MQLELDVRTSLYLIAYGNILCSLLLLSYFSGNADNSRAFKYFFSGRIVQSVAWILLCLRGYIPDVYSSDLGNCLIFCGFALESMGFISMVSRHRAYPVILVALVVIGSLTFSFYSQEPHMKVAVASLFCALIYSTVVCSFLLFSSRTNLHQTLVLIFGSVVLLLLVRCYVAANPENNMTLFDRENLITSLTLLGIFGFLFAAGFGQLLLLKQHDDDRLKEAASKDPLTNVYNRRAFFEHVEHFANMAIRDRSCISFLMIDLDNFKSINDNFGHDHGDKVLIDFSEKVSQLIRREDVFGRFGGEEFCVMMACGKDKAMEVAERIRLAMTSHLVGRPESDYCTVSIGVCSDVPESSGCADRMIVVADGCLYKAKQEGRNRVLCA